MMEDLEKHDWPLSMDEIKKYEQEINDAEIFLSQSRELQQTSEKVVMNFSRETL